ncbi:MAG TPA: DUF6174 domain-containing protein [Roseiflexaceae bacterium]|nr:DUF6174 domain-containing protein [Roseiflexaceae bacterium]
MKHRTEWRGLLVALILLPILAACGAQSTVASDLSAAQQRWGSGGLVNYRYTLEITCFCVAPANEQLLVEVQNGATARITTVAGGEAVSSDQAERAGTVPSLFEIIRDAHERGADEVDVTYDEALGYPTRIRIDEHAQAADDEAVYQVSDLAEIPAASPEG